MKTQIKNLVKSALFGVTVLGGAMLTQSFGEKLEVEESTRPNLAFRYVNDGTKFVLNQTAEPEDGCSGSSSEHCVIETDQDMGSEFQYNQLPNDWQPYGSSTEAIYSPE